MGGPGIDRFLAEFTSIDSGKAKPPASLGFWRWTSRRWLLFHKKQDMLESMESIKDLGIKIGMDWNRYKNFSKILILTKLIWPIKEIH